MALFGTKKEKKVEQKATVKKAEKKAEVKEVTVNAPHGHTHVILRPHVTEKSGLLSQTGIYTFQVASGANKKMISQAVQSLYKVTPVKIAVTNLPAKKIFVRGKRGTVSAIRKAVVTVKKGDKIDFV